MLPRPRARRLPAAETIQLLGHPSPLQENDFAKAYQLLLQLPNPSVWAGDVFGDGGALSYATTREHLKKRRFGEVVAVREGG